MSKASQTISSHRGKTNEELVALLHEREKEIFEVRMSSFTDQERSPGQIRAIRRDIARIKTVMAEKQHSNSSKDDSAQDQG